MGSLVINIERNSSTPLYNQIKLVLRDQILKQEYRPGEFLPTEVELCEEFDVSRITVVRALRDLTSDGLIERIQGKGTIVAQSRIEGTLDRIISFSESMKKQGYTTRSEILSVQTEKGDIHLLSRLGLPADSREQFTHFRRLRFVDDKPALLMDTYVRKDLGDRLKTYDLGEASFFQLYEEILDRKVIRTDVTLSPIIASGEIVELLNVKPGSPHFLYEGVSFIEGGMPVEVATGVFHGQLIRFTTNVFRFNHQVISE
jgi:DNA-binding GntR family transcriptional regulator